VQQAIEVGNQVTAQASAIDLDRLQRLIDVASELNAFRPLEALGETLQAQVGLAQFPTNSGSSDSI
jgi:hypothetical protein